MAIKVLVRVTCDGPVPTRANGWRDEPCEHGASVDVPGELSITGEAHSSGHEVTIDPELPKGWKANYRYYRSHVSCPKCAAG